MLIVFPLKAKQTGSQEVNKYAHIYISKVCVQAGISFILLLSYDSHITKFTLLEPSWPLCGWKHLVVYEWAGRKLPKIINKLDSVSSKSRRALTQNFQSGTIDFPAVKVANVSNEVSPVKTLEIQINPNFYGKARMRSYKTWRLYPKISGIFVYFIWFRCDSSSLWLLHRKVWTHRSSPGAGKQTVISYLRQGSMQIFSQTLTKSSNEQPSVSSVLPWRAMLSVGVFNRLSSWDQMAEDATMLDIRSPTSRARSGLLSISDRRVW